MEQLSWYIQVKYTAGQSARKGSTARKAIKRELAALLIGVYYAKYDTAFVKCLAVLVGAL